MLRAGSRFGRLARARLRDGDARPLAQSGDDGRPLGGGVRVRLAGGMLRLVEARHCLPRVPSDRLVAERVVLRARLACDLIGAERLCHVAPPD